jgi:hypothetical protein
MVHESVRLLGGVARTSELLRLGHEAEWIRMAVYYGRIIRIRRGVFGNLDLPAAVIDAWRVGGRLACVSALEHHGVIKRTNRPPHVHVERNASRLRLRPGVVVHSSRRARTGDRWAVSVEQALRQALRCVAIRTPIA